MSSTTISAPWLSGVNRQQPHLDQIDDAAKRIGDVRRADAAGNLDRHRIGPEPLADFVDRAVEIGPFAVHLVDERQPRHAVFVGLPPDRFALRLDPFAGAEHDHAAVQHAQAALHFGGEIDVARACRSG